MRLEWITRAVSSKTGWALERTGETTLRSAVQARMRVLDFQDDDRYLSWASANPSEIDALVKSLIVPETWFYRQPAAFEHLQARAHAQQARGHRAFTVLSVACSTGEEVWSIAIALDRAGVPPERRVIFGVDLGAAALDVARLGVYEAPSFRGVGAAALSPPLEQDGAVVRVPDSLRAGVSFHEGNITEPGTLPSHLRWDAIFCRNLLIYLQDDVAIRLLDQLRQTLRPDGLLYSGHGDTRHLTKRFTLDSPPAAFAWAAVDREPSRPPTPKVTPTAPPPSAPAAPRSPAPPVRSLAAIQRLADTGAYAEGLAACRSLAARDGPSAALAFLHGVLLEATGASAEAQRQFRDALYLEPTHADALRHLACVLERSGDIAGAQRTRERLARVQSRTVEGGS